MSYQEFKNKYACETNVLQFYQLVSARPKHLATKAKNPVPPESEPYTENKPLFPLDDLKTIHLGEGNARDFLLKTTKKLTQGVKLAQQSGIKLCSWVERPGKTDIYFAAKNL